MLMIHVCYLCFYLFIPLSQVFIIFFHFQLLYCYLHFGSLGITIFPWISFITSSTLTKFIVFFSDWVIQATVWTAKIYCSQDRLWVLRSPENAFVSSIQCVFKKLLKYFWLFNPISKWKPQIPIHEGLRAQISKWLKDKSTSFSCLMYKACLILFSASDLISDI